MTGGPSADLTTLSGAAGRCVRDDCPLRDGPGACAAGHVDPIDCESFQIDELAQVRVDPETPVQISPESSGLIDARGRNRIVEEGLRHIHRGKALNADETSRFLYGCPANTAVFLGPVGVGKTTLLASIYDCFSADLVADWTFAGSRTLIGFEERRFSADRRSGTTEVRQQRTSLDTQDIFLHLRLSHNEGGQLERRDLLLADISGEHLTNLVSRNEPGPLASLLPTAKVIAYLVDGSALADPARCWQAVENTVTGTRALVERHHISPESRVLAVITKWDLFQSAQQREEVTEVLTRELRRHVPHLDLLSCAARPRPQSNVDEHTGVPALLALLAAHVPTGQLPVPTIPGSMHQPGRFQTGSPLLARLITAASAT